MDVARIGLAAGAIWKQLRVAESKPNPEHRGCSLVELKTITGFNADEVLAGVGWLAREGKVAFETGKKKLVLRLAETELVACS